MYSQCLKSNFFDQCVLPVMSDGTKTWLSTLILIRKLKNTQRAMKRAMLGVRGIISKMKRSAAEPQSQGSSGRECGTSFSELAKKFSSGVHDSEDAVGLQ